MYFNLYIQESSKWSRIYCLIIAGWASFEIQNEYIRTHGQEQLKEPLDEGKDILDRWASSLILAPTVVLSGKKFHPKAHSNVRQGGE